MNSNRTDQPAAGPTEPSPPNKLTSKLEQHLGTIVLLLLLGGCLLVMRPFVSALLWAVVLCYASWPVYRRLLRLFRNNRTLAGLVMMAGMILVVLMPFIIIGSTLGENVNQLTSATKRWIQEGPPKPPEWLAKVPVVGKEAMDYWQSMSEDPQRLWRDVQPYVERVSSWFLRAGISLGRGLAELALSVFIAFFLFRHGTSVAESVATGVERIAGPRGKHLLNVAGNTVRGVVYGILGTALAQGVFAGIGYVIAGVPAAALLALLTFFFSVVPVVGTALVWLPAAFWLFNQGRTGWGIFMIVWGLIVGNIDNVLKPWLISQGSNMPFLLIFFGVLGGALTFGFIGVFLGPTLLAVGFRVVEEWSSTVPAVAAEVEQAKKSQK